MKSDRTEKLIREMSVEEKARQLTQLNADFIKTDMDIAATGVSGELNLCNDDVCGCGSVLNFGDAYDAEYIRKKYLENSERKIPLVMMQDVIHGYRTIFPVPIAQGCSFDAELAEECARASAREASLNGVDVTFSPMVNLVRDARWGRVMETYGEDPWLNGVFGRAVIRGYRAGGLASCVKHYAAYGAAEAGRDYNTTDLSEYNLREYYLPAFKECLKEEPEVIMTSFNLLNGLPVNADSHLLNDILRDEWGYDGVVVSDYSAVTEMIKHGYCEDIKDCARVAANNNVDLEMMSTAYVRSLPELIREGAADISTVDAGYSNLKKSSTCSKTLWGAPTRRRRKRFAFAPSTESLQSGRRRRALFCLKITGFCRFRKAGKSRLWVRLPPKRIFWGRGRARAEPTRL